LPFPFPQAQPRTVAAPRIGSDQQSPGLGIRAPPFRPPPCPNGRSGKGRGVMIRSDIDEPLVARPFVEAVGLRPRDRRVWKIVTGGARPKCRTAVTPARVPPSSPAWRSRTSWSRALARGRALAAHGALHTALPISHFDRLGLLRLAGRWAIEAPDADPQVRWHRQGVEG
jgi:hypothetical protein